MDSMRTSVLIRSEILKSLYLFKAITVAKEKNVMKVDVTGMADRSKTVGKITCVIRPQIVGMAMPDVMKNDWYLNSLSFLTLKDL